MTGDVLRADGFLGDYHWTLSRSWRVNLEMRGADVMTLEPRRIVLSAERLEDCQDSLEETFHEIVDQAISRGWSIDETLIALNSLISKELADPNRAITLH